MLSVRSIARVALATLLASALSHASATLLLEEPYGHMGFFTGTGHAAVYLSNICADDLRVLRLCAPGETGVVLSRYDHIAGYDWLAVPLIPYLYAVDRPEDVPLFADARMVAFLRDSYRRQHLERIIPDDSGAKTPGGNWYQLVGSSYDRTIYGFEIETTPEQDAALIRKLNSSPNRSHFHLLSRNCADFAKDIINFYYPKTLHRSVIADVGITTPKQISKTLVKFNAHHPDVAFSRLVIAQVPGTMPRSAAPKGVVESFLKSTKYIVPSAIGSPVFAGCVFAVYVGTGAGRFRPDRNAMVFTAGSNPEPPVARADRKAYQRELKRLLAEADPAISPKEVDKSWERMQSKTKMGFDDQNAPILEVRLGEQQVSMGVSPGNLRNGTAPPQLVEQFLAARLQSELRHAPANGISQTEIARDWSLLKQVLHEKAARTQLAQDYTIVQKQTVQEHLQRPPFQQSTVDSEQATTIGAGNDTFPITDANGKPTHNDGP
ncbi:MAG: hypothetical protein ACRD3Q_06810 [Terriglobales bacterium]